MNNVPFEYKTYLKLKELEERVKQKQTRYKK